MWKREGESEEADFPKRRPSDLVLLTFIPVPSSNMATISHMMERSLWGSARRGQVSSANMETLKGARGGTDMPRVWRKAPEEGEVTPSLSMRERPSEPWTQRAALGYS